MARPARQFASLKFTIAPGRQLWPAIGTLPILLTLVFPPAGLALEPLTKPAIKSAAKPVSKSETKPEAKPESKSAAKPENKLLFGTQAKLPRLASLAPSNTELLCTAGASKQIVGISTYCDYPAEITSVDKVGTFVSANLERLARLKPDLVLLVSGQEELAAKVSNHKFKTVVINNQKLQDIGNNLRQIGTLSGHNKEAALAAAKFEQSLTGLASIVQKSKYKPKVFYCVWPQPLMTAGKASFINGVITSCGGINVAGEMAASYPRFSLERLVLSNPDVIIMPFEARNQSFIKQVPWSKLQAVKENRVYYLPDQKHDVLSRPTLRILKGLAWLATIFHPELAKDLKVWSSQASTI